MTSKVKTRILIVSDTHSYKPEPHNPPRYVLREPLPKADIAIHAGDLTMNGKIEQHENTVSLLKSIDAELKIVIPGNHDLTLDTAYYEQHGQLYGPRPEYTTEQLEHIREAYNGTEAKEAGIYYLEEGTRTLCLKNGVEFTIHASAYTPEFCQWSFAYPLWEDRFNQSNPTSTIQAFNTDSNDTNGKNIDILITHGPPHTILDQTSRNDKVGCSHLLTAVSRSRPLLHCFGHIHEAWGAVRKTWPSSSILSSTTYTHLNSESLSRDAKMAQYDRLKQGQLEAWTRDHATTEQEIGNDGEVELENGAAFVDATDLKRGEETLFVNASIMNLQYKPVQAPWVVDLLLNRKEQ